MNTKAKTDSPDLMLASTKPGHTWRVTCYKNSGGSIQAVAQEGRRMRHTYRDGLTGTSWETAIGLAGDGDRRHRLVLDYPQGAPLTQKRIADGLYKMRLGLLANGLATDGPLELFEDRDERAGVPA
jgi:hypothetical protein